MKIFFSPEYFYTNQFFAVRQPFSLIKVNFNAFLMVFIIFHTILLLIIIGQFFFIYEISFFSLSLNIPLIN